MGLLDRKITSFVQPVTSLDDKPQMTAAALKAAFDSNSNELRPALNGVIDDLSGTGGAGEIGVTAISGVDGTTVQLVLVALKALIDLCDTTEEVDEKLDLKADKTTTDKLIKTVEFDTKTGVFTLKTDDGTTTQIDTLLEKVPISCRLDGEDFVLTLEDGTEQRVSLSVFLKPDEFINSDTIDFSVSGNTVTASIKAGSITLEMLESTILSTFTALKEAAETAAQNAAASEANAAAHKDNAAASATQAAEKASESAHYAEQSQSWAVGGTGKRNGEDTDNSKYYAGQSQTSAQSASSSMTQASTFAANAAEAAQRAEAAADQAEAVVGGDFATKLEAQKYVDTHNKSTDAHAALFAGKADLVDGKVPEEQLPDMDFIPNREKGAAGGVAPLGPDGKVPEEHLPEMEYLPLAGGTMAGQIDMDGQKMIGLPEPAGENEAATKRYVDQTARKGGSGMSTFQKLMTGRLI